MQSKVLLTHEIDDIAAAAAELTAGLPAFAEGEAAGILLCYADMDVAELAAAVQARVAFPVVGATTIALMEREEGFHEMAATLTVLYGEGVRFAAEASAPLTPENAEAEVAAACARLCEALGSPPALLFALPPYILSITLDSYVDSVNNALPGVPMVGGLPSNIANGDENLVLYRGGVTGERMVLLGMAGEVHPVFSVQNVQTEQASRKRRVTRSEGNTVYEVNGQRFTDYLAEIGLPVSSLVEGNTTVAFASNPVLVESAEEGYSYLRALHAVDLETGSATAIGRVPQGATVSVCPMPREGIVGAGAAGMEDIRAKMARYPGYRYSTVVAVSCISRHLLLQPQSDAEAKGLVAALPEGVSLTGFYGYGEIGPQGLNEDRNFAHNESLILCAF